MNGLQVRSMEYLCPTEMISTQRLFDIIYLPPSDMRQGLPQVGVGCGSLLSSLYLTVSSFPNMTVLAQVQLVNANANRYRYRYRNIYSLHFIPVPFSTCLSSFLFRMVQEGVERDGKLYQRKALVCVCVCVWIKS